MPTARRRARGRFSVAISSGCSHPSSWSSPGARKTARALREGRVRARAGGEVNNRLCERCVLDSGRRWRLAPSKPPPPLRAEQRCDRPRSRPAPGSCRECPPRPAPHSRWWDSRHDEDVSGPGTVDSRAAQPPPHRRGRNHAHVEPLAQTYPFRAAVPRLVAAHRAVGDHDQPRDRGPHLPHCPCRRGIWPTRRAAGAQTSPLSSSAVTEQARQCRDLSVESRRSSEVDGGRRCPGDDEHPRPAA